MVRKLIYILTSVICLTGCIDNDLPYPVVVPHIVSLEADGAESISIDYQNQTVTAYFPETKDLRNVSPFIL